MALRLQADRERAALRRNAQRPLIGLLPLLALAGCGVFEDGRPLPCPGVSVPERVQTLTLYRDGPGRDLSDVAFEMVLSVPTARCDYAVEEDGSGVVESALVVAVAGRRGPAAETDSVRAPFFVAVVGPEGRIRAKEVFAADLAFDETAAQVRASREIEQRIPLPAAAQGPAYVVHVGFQLTRAQLEDARRAAE